MAPSREKGGGGGDERERIRFATPGSETRVRRAWEKRGDLPPAQPPAAPEPIDPLPGPRFIRSAPAADRSRARWTSNWPALHPERFLRVLDLDDFGIASYGRAPLIDAAIDQIVERRVKLKHEIPLIERTLSPFTAIVLEVLREEAHTEPLPFLSALDTTLLKKPRDSLLVGALLRLARRAAQHDLITQVSMEDTFGELGAELFEQWVHAMPLHRGLQHTLLRSALPIEPHDPTLPPTREEVRATLAADPARADRLLAATNLRAEGARRSRSPEVKSGPIYVVARIELTVSDLETIEALGVGPGAAELIAAPWSSGGTVAHALETRGYRVHFAEGDDPKAADLGLERAITAALGEADSRASGRVLVLDRGGRVARRITALLPDERERFVVVEPEIADTPEEETARAGAAVRRIESTFRVLSMPPIAGRTAVVIGSLSIGRAVGELLRAHGAEVADPKGSLAAASLIVCASGASSIRAEHVKSLAHEAVLASVTESPVEIDFSGSRDPFLASVPVLAEGPGDRRFATRLWRFRDRDLLVLRNGFSIATRGELDEAPARGPVVDALFAAWSR